MKVERWKVADLPPDTVAAMQRQSLFSSPSFGNLWTAQGGRSVCWVCTDQNRILAGLLGVEFHSRPFTRFQAMPDGLYASVYFTHGNAGLKDEQLSAILKAIGSARYAKVLLTDRESQFTTTTEYVRQQCETPAIDISAPGWGPPDATLRSEIRKAERDGVQVVPFDAGRHLSSFLDLSRRTEARHGREPKYCDAFYAGLAELAAVDSRVVWMVVEHDGVPAASQIHLVDGATALYWQSVFDKKYSFLKPNQYMLYTVIGRLAGQGVTEFLLGASPDEAGGLRTFKEKWGGLPKTYPLYIRKSWAGRLW